MRGWSSCSAAVDGSADEFKFENEHEDDLVADFDELSRVARSNDLGVRSVEPFTARGATQPSPVEQQELPVVNLSIPKISSALLLGPLRRQPNRRISSLLYRPVGILPAHVGPHPSRTHRIDRDPA